MKKLLLAIVLTVSAFFAYADENPFFTKLPFEKATIKYTIDGSAKGTKTVAVKEYGKYTSEHTESTMEVFGTVENTVETVITTPDWIYTISNEFDYVSRSTNPDKYVLEEYNSLSDADKAKFMEQINKSGTIVLAGIQGTAEANAAEILGYKCDKITMAGITAYVFHDSDLDLKSEGEIVGFTENTFATSVEEGVADEKMFELPAGKEIVHDTEFDALNEDIMKMMVMEVLSSEIK